MHLLDLSPAEKHDIILQTYKSMSLAQIQNSTLLSPEEKYELLKRKYPKEAFEELKITDGFKNKTRTEKLAYAMQAYKKSMSWDQAKEVIPGFECKRMEWFRLSAAAKKVVIE